MKTFNLLLKVLLALVIPISFASCNGDKDVAEKLLKTVPGDTPTVSVVNLENSIKNAGIEINDCAVLLKKEFGNDASKIQDLMSGKEGLNTKTAVIFLYGSEPVITMRLSNADKFRKALDQLLKDPEWKEEGSITYCEDANIVFNKKQVWFFSDKKTFKKYEDVIDVDEKDSFAKTVKDYDKMMDLSKDVTSLTNLSKLGSLMSNTDFGNVKTAAVINLAMGLIGENISYISSNVTFSKTKAEIEGQIFNDKCKPAKSNLKLKEIDTSVMQKYLSEGEFVLAVGMDDALLNKLTGMAEGLGIGGTELSTIKNLAKNINGTAAATISPSGQGVTAVISTGTPGEAIGLLNDLNALIPGGLNEMARPEGNHLLINFPATASNPNLSAKVAGMFKGANIGLYIKTKELKEIDYVMLTIDTDKLSSLCTVTLADGTTFAKLIKSLK